MLQEIAQPSSIMQEIALLKFLTVRDNFEKYIRYVSDFNLEQETSSILKAIKDFFEEYKDKDSISVAELVLFNNLKNPLTKNKELYQELFTSLDKLDVDSKLIKENFNNLLEKYCASELLFKITSFLENQDKNFVPAIQEELDKFEDAKLRLNDSASKFVTTDIATIVKKREEKPGLHWRIESLNTHLGDIRGKTLGHIFARVDTGKTSFVLSEEAFWVKQLKDDECIVHFNNEEDGEKLMTRFYQALLNVDKTVLFSLPDKCKKEFDRLGGNRFKLYDEAIISIEDIEDVLKTHNVRALVIDQADKIVFHGQNKLGDVARLQMTYAKLRELSKKYDVHILTVGQASQSAENKKWLLPTDIDSSKTLKPGEFDYIIGIGRLFGEPISSGLDIRYIHLCKNKLGTGNHAQLEVLINTQRALYREPTYEELEIAYGNIPKDASPEQLPFMAD